MEFKQYSEQVVENAKTLAQTLKDRGFDIVSDGTDTHLVLVDLRPKGLKGNDAEQALEKSGMTCNKNSIPFDPEKPTITSGIRLGTPAATSRGFLTQEFEEVGQIIGDILDIFQEKKDQKTTIQTDISQRVSQLCSKFPIYPNF